MDIISSQAIFYMCPVVILLYKKHIVYNTDDIILISMFMQRYFRAVRDVFLRK